MASELQPRQSAYDGQFDDGSALQFFAAIGKVS